MGQKTCVLRDQPPAHSQGAQRPSHPTGTGGGRDAPGPSHLSDCGHTLLPTSAARRRCPGVDLTQAQCHGFSPAAPTAASTNQPLGPLPGPSALGPSPVPQSPALSRGPGSRPLPSTLKLQRHPSVPGLDTGPSPVSQSRTRSLSPRPVPQRSAAALTARVRPERHQHEVVREPRHGEGRGRAPRLGNSRAARSWPGPGPGPRTPGTLGPLRRDQGFRRHLPSQPARPATPCACARAYRPCRRGL